MKRQMLFVLLLAASSQMSPRYHHGWGRGYWGGGPRFGLYVGSPGYFGAPYGYGPYGYSPYGYGYGYYNSPLGAVADTIGTIATAETIKSDARSRERERQYDAHKDLKAKVKGQIFDAEDRRDAAKKKYGAHSSEVKEAEAEIEKLYKRLKYDI